MLSKHTLAAMSVAGFSFFAASAFSGSLNSILPPANTDSGFTLIRGGGGSHGGGGGHGGFGGRSAAMGGFSRGPMMSHGPTMGGINRGFVSRPTTFHGQRFIRGGRFHGHRRVFFRHGRR